MTGLRRTLLPIAIVLVGLAASPPASAQTALSASIAKKAVLADGGQAVLVTVTLTCPAGAEPLEAFVYVVQGGFESQWGFIPVTCDGVQRTTTVRVQALDFLFRPGKARASGYVLTTDGESVSPTRIIQIKKHVR